MLPLFYYFLSFVPPSKRLASRILLFFSLNIMEIKSEQIHSLQNVFFPLFFQKIIFAKAENSQTRYKLRIFRNIAQILRHNKRGRVIETILIKRKSQGLESFSCVYMVCIGKFVGRARGVRRQRKNI